MTTKITLAKAKEIFKKDHPNYEIMPYVYFRDITKGGKIKRLERNIEIIKLKNKGLSCKIIGKKYNLTRAQIWAITK